MGHPGTDEQVPVEGLVPTDEGAWDTVVDRAPPTAALVDPLQREPVGGDVGELPVSPKGRYVWTEEIGRGGMGVVREARDELFGREVAVKQLLDPGDGALKARFLEEARVTAQLEHPNVVPVHDLGFLESGEVYFAMKRVRGRTLADVLDGLEEGDETVAAEFSRVRLLTLFQQVCMGVHYAHSRGVVHRDLKPENLMVGAYGEVHVMDWGVARVLSRGEEPASKKSLVPTQEAMTAHGAVVGTPSYMPPEQAQGQHDRVGPHSDVYALGALLYEILTGSPPFRERTPLATIVKVVTEEPIPPRERSPERGIPEELEELCLRALAKDPGERPATARAIFDAVEEFLEGTRDRQRRRAEAARLADAGRNALERAEQAEAEIAELQREEVRLIEITPPHAPVEAKRGLWTCQDRIKALEATRDRRVSESVQAYSEAVRNDPDLEEARRRLADYYWARLVEAEDRRDRIMALHFLRLVRQHNDGAYDAKLKTSAPLVVTSEPPGAAVMLHALAPIDRVMQAGPPKDLGVTPCEPEEVLRGSYLLVIALEGYETLRRPVLLSRQAEVSVSVRLFPPEVVGEGFIQIPAGPAILGGDLNAHRGQVTRVVDIPDFAIAQRPVTCAEYVEFLNHLIADGHHEEAAFRAPREWGGGGALLDTGGGWALRRAHHRSGWRRLGGRLARRGRVVA